MSGLSDICVMAIFPGSAIPSAVSDYTIDQSLRFNDDDSAYLSRTPVSDGDKRTFTISCWVKRGTFSEQVVIASAGNSVSSDPQARLFINRSSSGNTLEFHSHGGTGFSLGSTAVFRDPSSWYHIVAAIDTTQAVAADRGKLYVNGTQLTSFSSETYPAQDVETDFNAASEVQYVGVHSDGGSLTKYYDGYLAEFYLIDGTQYAASDFGETDSTTNQWIPKDASGLTFGTNGFYLKFQDSAALGDDSSGNTNDFTVTNLVATDQMKDSPSNNFATFNIILGDTSSGARISYVDFSEGNLKAVGNYGSETGLAPGTFSFGTGKWYVEFDATSLSGAYPHLGIIETTSATTQGGYVANSVMYKADGGIVKDSTSTGGWGDSWVAGDVIGMAIDCTNGAVYFAKNNTWQDSGDPTSGASKTGAALTWTGETIDFVTTTSPYTTSAGVVMNCGSDSSFAGNETAQGNQDGNGVGDFYYEPPTDFLALCTSNISDPSITLPGDNFSPLIYTGDGNTGRAVTGVGFAPDFTWIKNREQTREHVLVDSIRLANNYLSSNTSGPEIDNSNFVTSLDSDGFTLGSNNAVNRSAYGFASWNWLASTTFDPKTAGTVAAASGRSNSTAGFSIVGYTGTGSSMTIGHGLAQTPELIIVKSRDRDPSFWVTGSSVSGMGFSANKYMYLNETNAVATNSAWWNTTNPTASVFTVGTDNDVNEDTETYISYCFHSVENFSKVGQWTGNGDADGPMVYTGFRPALLLMHRMDSATNWLIEDDKRLGYNVDNNDLLPDDTAIEATDDRLDIVSNGFKFRSTFTSTNADGGTYLYYAVAAYPFKYANAR